jgi:hypothetical protein
MTSRAMVELKFLPQCYGQSPPILPAEKEK